MRARSLSTLGVVVAGLAVVLSCGEIAQDELWCEEAVSQLQDCCGPDFDPRLLPCVRTAGCDHSETRPSLSMRSAECILARACPALRNDGVCTRAIAGSRLPYTLKGEGTAFDEGVCR
jgi:hypothetical protein